MDGNSFVVRKPKRTRLGQYWATMGFIFQIVRDIDPKLKYMIDTFTLIGLFWSTKSVFSTLFSTLQGIRIFVWARIWSLDLRRLYGEYVVITGATDGIGLEYAREFARRGHSLILLGRNEQKLADVEREFAGKMGSNKIITIKADFNSNDPKVFQEISSKLRPYSKDIGILINNAGVMFSSPNRYLDQSEADVISHINVNIMSLLKMTRAVLPFMIQRRKGLIVNISSVAAYKPLPLMGVYSASKIFVEYFSKTLEVEYSKYNINVQTLCPSYVSTKMLKWSNLLQKPSFLTPNAESFVKSAVATIGRTSETTGYWSHGLQLLTYQCTPNWLYKVMSWQLQRNLDSSGKWVKN